ncbi:hypothetical protein bcCo53_001257 (plasmid) [Borrelia coriaceae]|uniref:Uncharacterized protein n=1 Tax=Borrelia coriaceae ATCC 43381 TaxID=1408429 RepID=W5T1R3_9SPIR|nr:hypothetical protein [Borrelia coriaceae]AHH11211.1 hypothetical protein BCO_0900046 [Borrelia coriaceae ATCC 43381]UPA17088.1 hypothetical protein bcCo53_001257 [Borrelia coriaceae]
MRALFINLLSLIYVSFKTYDNHGFNDLFGGLGGFRLKKIIKVPLSVLDVYEAQAIMMN